MFGDKGNIRAIRVICGENGSQVWPQRGAKGARIGGRAAGGGRTTDASEADGGQRRNGGRPPRKIHQNRLDGHEAPY